MRIKRLIFMLLSAIIICGTATAQNRQQQLSREELANKQAERIAEKLDLKDNVKSQFIATFCEYQNAVWSLDKENPNTKPSDTEVLTDEQVEKKIMQRFNRSHKILELREEFYTKYRQFLTPRQIENVYHMEKKMLDKMAKHRHDSRAKSKH